MKTLVRPQPYTTIAISADSLVSNKIVRNQKIYQWNNKKIVSYLFLLLSFSIFLFLPESPKLSESICTNNNSQEACNIW